MRLFLVLLLFLSPILAFTQSNVNISQKEALNDLNILAKRMDKIHPVLFENEAKERFRNQFKSYYREINRHDSLSILDFYKIVGKIPPSLNDGHTRVMPPKNNMRKNVFPLQVNINDSAIIVQNDYSINKSIPAGSKILSIIIVPSIYWTRNSRS